MGILEPISVTNGCPQLLFPEIQISQFSLSTCAKSYTFKPVSAATKSEPSSGKSFRTSTGSSRTERTPANLNFNWNASTSTHIENPRRIPRPYYEHVFGGAFAQSVGHGGGALQRHAVGAPTGGEHGRNVLHRQRGALRHLLPHAEADDAHLRRSQPSGVADDERSDDLPALPRPTQRRSA